MMFNKILVVCVGNICRSPTGEALLKQKLPNHTIASAGVGALVGDPADAQASQVAQQHGVDLSTHVAQQLTSELAAQYDLMLVKFHRQRVAKPCCLGNGCRKVAVKLLTHIDKAMKCFN